MCGTARRPHIHPVVSVLASPPLPTELAQITATDRGLVLVDPRTTTDGWVLSPTGHDTLAVATGYGQWTVQCARCGRELDGPWVSPGAALDAAAGHATRP